MGRHGRNRMVVGYTIICAIGTYQCTKVVSSNPVNGEAYSIQHYVIKFVSDLRQVGGFPPGTPVSFTNKTDRHDITVLFF